MVAEGIVNGIRVIIELQKRKYILKAEIRTHSPTSLVSIVSL